MLEIKNLNAYYGSSHILHDVSLSVDEGDLVTLIGRNGAGKTTTLNSIMGIVNEKSGSVQYGNKEILGEDPHKISARGISIIPEGRELFEQLTVRENLRLGFLGHDINGDEADLLAPIFEYFPRLEERQDQKAGSLSGGEQQMVAIGRGLVSDPDFLLVDEPTEGLMPSLVEKLANILERINNNGISILLVEQNVNLALNISNYAYIIDEGVIVEEGNSQNLREDQEIIDTYLAV